MKSQENENQIVFGYGIIAVLLVVIVLLAFMQSNIEKMQDKIKVIDHRLDSIELIQSYPYDHSKINKP